MSDDSDSLDWEELDQAVADDADWSDAHGLDLIRLSDPQHAWVSMPARFALWRGGNSIGKTFAQAVDITHTARGTHPWRRVRRAPVRLLVVGYSFAQMDPLCRTLWQMLPKDEIDPRVQYEPENGFRGFKIPAIPFVRGPGQGSVIGFATYEQGSGRIMGNQVHGAYLDEPPPEHIYGEVRPRLNALNAFLRMTFTPTPDSPPLEYLRELVDVGVQTGGRRGLVEMQTSLTAAAITPRGGLFELPRMPQSEIDEAIDGYLDDERDMRAHGAWTALRRGRWVSTFSESENVLDFPPPAGAYVVVSIDHGAQAGKQAVMVQAITDRDEPLLTRVWWLAEHIAEDATTPEEDAKHIIDLLASLGMTVDHVDLWVGDRSLDSKFLAAKSNDRLRRALALRLRRDLEDTPRIVVPHKYPGSLRAGAAMVRALMKRRLADGRPAGIVAPRCAAYRRSLLSFMGKRDDPEKDIFDAGRYGPEMAIRGRRTMSADVRL